MDVTTSVAVDVQNRISKISIPVRFLMNTPLSTTCGDVRIFRAIEGADGETQTADFLVPAPFLKASEALEVMAGPDPVVHSDDEKNVIKFHDTIKGIKSLVAWMTRETGFELNDENIRDLAYLSDKYIIDSLYREIRIYTQLYPIRKVEPTMDLWMFSARYGFDELEAFCRAKPPLSTEISNILCDRERGVKFFVSAQNIPLTTVTKIVADLIKRESGGMRYCKFCCGSTYCVCGSCGQQYT